MTRAALWAAREAALRPLNQRGFRIPTKLGDIKDAGGMLVSSSPDWRKS
jgi:hypothetical protein